MNFINNLRQNKKFTWLRVIILLLFPVYTVFCAEITAVESTVNIINLVKHNFSILLFDIIFVSLVFGTLTLIIRRFYISSLITGLFFYIISCVEFFRFQGSGTHFSLYDLALFTNVSDVAEFTSIGISPLMLSFGIITIAYSAVFFILFKSVSFSKKYTLSISAVATATMVAFFSFPHISKTVFDRFNINNDDSNNSFVMEEKFDENNLIAFLAQNTTEFFQNKKIKIPKLYSKKTINSFINLDNKKEFSTNTPADKGKQKPNIITIMSESYTDFRNFPKLEVDDSYYKNFDKFSEEGKKGTAIVSAFGGYTIKSEFELLFGLPISSLNSTSSPQKIIDTDIKQSSIASYYKLQGYTTSYMHPYTTAFYDREVLIPSLSFDNVYFEQDFEQLYFKKYLDDGVAFKKAYQQLKKDEDPSYIHLTTMQNHMPYSDENSDISQFQYYLDGIKNTDKRLKQFIDVIQKLKEPTIILFVGDHYPLFTEENSVYDQLGISGDNCAQLFEQDYFVWSNYPVDYSKITADPVSLFYLPHILSNLANLPQNNVTSTVLSQIENTPIYTREYNSNTKNKILDTITYDLILGKKYLLEKV